MRIAAAHRVRAAPSRIKRIAMPNPRRRQADGNVPWRTPSAGNSLPSGTSGGAAFGRSRPVASRRRQFGLPYIASTAQALRRAMQPPALPGDMFLLERCWLANSIVILRAALREGDSPRGRTRRNLPEGVRLVPQNRVHVEAIEQDVGAVGQRKLEAAAQLDVRIGFPFEADHA